jgi:hypothetical protein
LSSCRCEATNIAHYIVYFFADFSVCGYQKLLALAAHCRGMALVCCFFSAAGASVSASCRNPRRLKTRGALFSRHQHLGLTLQFGRADLASHVTALEIGLGDRHVSLDISTPVLTNLAKLLGVGLSGGRSTFTNCPKEVGIVGASNAKASLKQRHVLRFSAAVAFVCTGIPYPVHQFLGNAREHAEVSLHVLLESGYGVRRCCGRGGWARRSNTTAATRALR